MSCHPSRTCLFIMCSPTVSPTVMSFALLWFPLQSSSSHPVLTPFYPFILNCRTFHLTVLGSECFTRICGLRSPTGVVLGRLYLQSTAGLLHGGLSVPVCMGAGSLLVNPSLAHRSGDNWLACIAHRFIAPWTVPQFDLRQRANE